jgi:uncharacterized protein YdeI (YjbR/CyaY-like superfamily)
MRSGWCSGAPRPAARSALYLSRRKKGSTWSASNKTRLERLIPAGLVQPAGLAAIERAKADGSWTILDAVEALQVPDDLAAALSAQPEARAHYESFGRGAKKQILWWVISAKKPETRAARIAEVVAKAVEGVPARG